MPKIPLAAQVPHPKGLRLIHEGKVRNTYELPGYSHLRLVITTARLSSYDIVLPCLVPGKGICLNLIDIWWRMQLLERMPYLLQDIVAWGEDIDTYLPEHLRGDPTLWMSARIIKVVEMIPAEMIWRGTVIGSIWKAVEKGQPYCGIALKAGTRKLDPISPPIFTPTTKAEVGHDKPMTHDRFMAIVNPNLAKKAKETTRTLFELGREIAAAKELDILDTKLEGGGITSEDANNPDFVVADEVLTPDSSRISTREAMEEARKSGKNPKSYDKQPVRDWMAEELGVDADTELTDDVVDRVHKATIPPEVVTSTAERYWQIFTILTGFNSGEEFVKNKGKLLKAA